MSIDTINTVGTQNITFFNNTDQYHINDIDWSQHHRGNIYNDVTTTYPDNKHANNDKHTN